MIDNKTILVNGELHRKLKVHCAEHNLKIKDVITKLIVEMLEVHIETK